MGHLGLVVDVALGAGLSVVFLLLLRLLKVAVGVGVEGFPNSIEGTQVHRHRLMLFERGGLAVRVDKAGDVFCDFLQGREILVEVLQRLRDRVRQDVDVGGYQDVVVDLLSRHLHVPAVYRFPLGLHRHYVLIVFCLLEVHEEVHHLALALRRDCRV